MKKRLTLDEFIFKSNLIHKNKYDYTFVNYINNHTNIQINCFLHGIFIQRPQHHLDGSECPKCAKLKTKKLHTSDSFVLDAKKIHGDKYDYSNLGYIKKKIKVSIKCYKHGVFLQTPLEHLTGAGCPKCSHVISKPETEFLDYLNIKQRNHRLSKWIQKPVDGYDVNTNTVYEFLGDYWHGNPIKYKSTDIHPRKKKSYGEIYVDTFKVIEKVKLLGYNVKYIWETDWNNFKKGIDSTPKIHSL